MCGCRQTVKVDGENNAGFRVWVVFLGTFLRDCYVILFVVCSVTNKKDAAAAGLRTLSDCNMLEISLRICC